MYRIFDRCDNRTRWAASRIELEETLRGMFDEGEDGVADAIEAICRGIGSEYVGDHETFLNIEVSMADCRDCSKLPVCSVGRTRARERRKPCIDFTAREEA